MTKVLMVCLGNICRSPMAEGLMRDYLAKNQRSDIKVASADSFHQLVVQAKLS